MHSFSLGSDGGKGGSTSSTDSPLQHWKAVPHAVLVELTQMVNTTKTALLGRTVVIASSDSGMLPFLVIMVALITCVVAVYHACTVQIFEHADTHSSAGRYLTSSQCAGASRPMVMGAVESRSSCAPMSSHMASVRSTASHLQPSQPCSMPPSAGFIAPPTAGSLTRLSLPPAGSTPFVVAQTHTSWPLVEPAFATPRPAPATAKSMDQPGSTSPRLTAMTRHEPLCQALVLPNREAHMEIPISALQGSAAGSDVTILGPLGKAWGRAAFTHKAQGERVMEIMMSRTQGESFVASVTRPSDAATDEPAALEIRGPDGELYGTLARRPGSTTAFEARRATSAEMPPLVVINGDPAYLRLTAVAGADGRPFASVARGRARANGAEHLELRMMRGVDTALLLSCILAVFCFF